MSTVKIDVVADHAVASGGHAIIRLEGVALLPPGATFRIDPIDEMLADDSWPLDDLRPLEVRRINDGLELLIGPEVVDCPQLEPGLPVTISIPAAHISAEIVWPSLPGSSAPVREPIVMTPVQMAAEFAAAERAKAEARKATQLADAEARREHEQREVEAAAQRDTVVAAAIAAAMAAPPPADLAMPGTVVPIAPHITPPQAPSSAMFPAAGPTARLPANDYTAPPRTPVDMPMPVVKPATSTPPPAAMPRFDMAAVRAGMEPVRPSSGPPVEPDPSRDIGFRDMPKGAPMVRPMLEAARQLDAMLAKDTGPDRPAGEALASLSGTGSMGPSPSSSGQPAETDTLSRLVRSGPELIERDQTTMPAIVINHSMVSRSGPSESEGWRAMVLPFLAGIATTAAVVTIAIMLGGPSGPAPAAPPVGIAEAFVAGPQSPRGVLANDVDLSTALKFADQSLHGIDRPVDRAEAEFWLRKALSLTASHAQLRWAMTQLGTLSAQPISGQPDYGKARLLWEIAAVNGDPMAMCFLGTLTENGLGGRPDRGRALEYFKRAKEIGGCPTSDEAIARLSR